MRSELAEGIRNAVNALQGWTTPERAIEMADLLIEHKCRKYVEIGIFGGRTLIAAAMAMREMNIEGMAIGIDPWRVEAALEAENEANRDWWRKVDLEGIHRGCMSAIWAHHLEPWCTVIRAQSEHVFRLFSGIDALLIDGNHSEPVSVRDVLNYLPSVLDGGIVIMDDCDWQSTKAAQKMLEEVAECIKDAGHYRIFKLK